MVTEEINQNNNKEGVDNAITEESAGVIQESYNNQEQVGNQEKESAKTEGDATQEETASDDAGSPGTGTDKKYVKHVQNWRALRDAKDRAERERDEARAQLQQDDNRQTSNRQPEQEAVLGDDDLIEGKQFKRGQQQVNQRIAQLESQLIEAKIKGSYPDFDKIVNKDTLGMLRDTDPELAESLASNPNLYSQAVAAYKSIKRYGLASPTYKAEKERVNNNIAKPRTVTSLAPQQGESPLTRANAFANGLTDDLKAQLWKEMQDIAKNS